MLTPLDIETVEFKKVALGYSTDEVNSFLDKVILDFELLYKENAKLSDKVSVLEEGLEYYKKLEETLKNSIVLAEKTAADAKYSANQTSEQIIKEAQLKATEILQDSNKKLYQLEYETLRMKSKYDSIRAKIRLLLKTEMDILESSEAEFEKNLPPEDDPSAFEKIEEIDKPDNL